MTDATWNSVLVNTNPTYALIGLIDSSTYEVRVKAICSTGDSSNYSTTVNFTTDISCQATSNPIISSITNNSAMVSWTSGGNETQWELDYRLSTNATWQTVSVNTNPTYTLNGLSDSSTYEVRVKAICSIGDSSSYSTIVSFTTTQSPQTTYTITATAGDNGVISPSGVVSVLEGGSQTFTITPDNGYNIQEVLVDNINQGDTSSYTFSNVQANHSISVSFIAGIEDNVLYPDALIFPNPANNVLNIKSGQPFERVKITNLLGQVLYNAKIVNSDFSIDISAYNSGIYFVRLEGSQGIVTKKFVKKQ